MNKIKEVLKILFTWLLKYGWQIINIIVLIAIYVVNKGVLSIELLSGLWIFFILAGNMWKWFTKKL